MSEDLINCVILSGLFLALFGIGELMYHVFHVKAELTRKWSHIGTGVLTLLFPIMLSSHWYVLLMCSSFAVLLVGSMKYGFLKSINAVDRDTLGSILYPVAVYFCFLSMGWSRAEYTSFYLPILSLAFADPMAALVGKKWGVKSFSIKGHSKTYLGSLACAITAFVLCYTAIEAQWTTNGAMYVVAFSGLYAAIIAIVEAVSIRGYDNLTIPVAGVLLLQWGTLWV
jgi:phytol kinase